jgi:hypothetical protein
MIWILFYFNSLPDMPPGCALFSPEIMHRDFFMCNPNNTGHFEYPKFENHSYDEYCHKREVHNFLDRVSDEKYTVFYTRHTKLDGTSQNKIVGYYKVGKLKKFPRGFYSSESLLLPKSRCIPIDYVSRGVPASWGASSVREFVEETLRSMKNMEEEDIAEKYRSETTRIMGKVRGLSNIEALAVLCNDCNVNECCYWGRKGLSEIRRRLIEFYG